jgi:hypothetical protein
MSNTISASYHAHEERGSCTCTVSRSRMDCMHHRHSMHTIYQAKLSTDQDSSRAIHLAPRRKAVSQVGHLAPQHFYTQHISHRSGHDRCKRQDNQTDNRSNSRQRTILCHPLYRRYIAHDHAPNRHYQEVAGHAQLGVNTGDGSTLHTG